MASGIDSSGFQGSVAKAVQSQRRCGGFLNFYFSVVSSKDAGVVPALSAWKVWQNLGNVLLDHPESFIRSTTDF